MTGTLLWLWGVALVGAVPPPSPYVTAISEPVSLELAGSAPQVFSRGDGGWWLLLTDGGDLVRHGLDRELAVDASGEDVTRGVHPCEAHRVAPCEDGSWLQICSGSGAASDDTAWALLHDADWVLTADALIADQDAGALHSGGPVVCGVSLRATAFQPTGGALAPLVALDSDLGLLASPFGLVAEPSLQGGSLMLDPSGGVLSQLTVDQSTSSLVFDRLDAGTGQALQARHTLTPMASNETLEGPVHTVGVGERLLVVHIGGRTDEGFEADHGDLWLAVLDDRGTLLDHLVLTAWTGEDRGARDPHAAVQDERLVVVADVDGTPTIVVVTLDLAGLAEGDPSPVARAGADQEVLAGALAEVDGSDSYDPDDDVLTYAWTLVYQPGDAGLTTADLDGVDRPRVGFTPPVTGSYELRLTVTAGGDMAMDSVVLTAVESPDTAAGDNPPVADAGADRVIYLGDQAQADGSASFDLDGETLTWAWSLVAQPAASAISDADLAGSDTFLVTLTPDVEGVYQLSLVVADGSGFASDQVQVTALSRDASICSGCGQGHTGQTGFWGLLLAVAVAFRARAPSKRWRCGARQR